MHTQAQVDDIRDRVLANVNVIAGDSKTALIIEKIEYIENIESVISDARRDIKEAIEVIAAAGLNKKGFKMVLSRRKLAAKGGLEDVDRTLAAICGIERLGIQGELFLCGGK